MIKPPPPEIEFAEWPTEFQSNGARVIVTLRSAKKWGHRATPGAFVNLRGVHGCHLMHWNAAVLWQAPYEQERSERLRMLYGDRPLIEIGVEVLGIPGTKHSWETKNPIGVRPCG